MDYIKRLRDGILRPAAYAGILERSMGSAVLYIFLLVVIVSLPVHIFIAAKIGAYIGDFDKLVQEEVPDFTIRKGLLDIDHEQPVKIYDSGSKGPGSWLVIADTTGKSDVSALQGYENGIFFAREYFVEKTANGLQSVRYSDLSATDMNKSDLVNTMPNLYLVPVLFVLLATPTVFLFKLIQSFVLALFAMAIAALLGKPLEYLQGFKISAYALTLPVVLDGLHMAFLPGLPFFFAIYFAIAIAYVSLAVRALPVNDADSLN